MAKQGVVNIGLNVDYQKSLDAMIQEFRNTLTKISSEFKKTALTADLEAQIVELAKTTQAQFDKINNGKLDAKNFEGFRVKAEGQFEKISTDVENLKTSLDKLGGSDAAEKIAKQFNNLRESILKDYEALSDIMNIVDKVNTNIKINNSSNSVDSAMVDKYKELLQLADEFEKKEGAIYAKAQKSNGKQWKDNDVSNWAKNVSQQMEVVRNSLLETERLQKEFQGSSLDTDSLGYKELEVDLFKAQIAAQNAGVELKELRDIGRNHLSTHSLFPSIETSIKSVTQYREDIDDIRAVANEVIEKVNIAKSEAKQASQSIANVSTFQVKNGAIQVPIEIATKDEALQQQLQEIITRLQGYADGRSIVAKVKLTDATSDDAANQWAVIESKFTSVAGEEGKLLAKNKKHKIAMQELAAEYQKYLDMGGTNNFSDLTNHKVTVKNLSKAYEELCKSVQEATQSQEKQQTVTVSTGVDSETIQAVTQANKSLETQAEQTSTAIENEAKTAQSASEKFRKLAKEKGNATIANRELAKAAKETADALEREAAARKEAENSRGSKNTVDANTYSTNALQWQSKIKQELLESGNYAEVYNAKISQTAKGNVSFASSVQTMDGEWKSFTATLDNSGNIVSSKLKDLTAKQVDSIERAKEQARQLMEAYAAMASGESAQPTFYNKADMEEYLAYILEVTQSLETLNTKYKVAMNSDGGFTITKTIAEANGEIKTFVANFKDVDAVLSAAMYPKKSFNAFLEENFDSGKVSTSGVNSVITQYEELYGIAQKISSVKIKLSGLDEAKDAKQIEILRTELEKLQQEYKELYAVATLDGTPKGFEKLNDVFTETEREIEAIKAKMQDAFISKGNTALNNFEKKYSGYAGFDGLSSDLERIKTEIQGLSNQEGLNKVNAELEQLAQRLRDTKAEASNAKLGTLINEQTFSDINAVRANIDSLFASIGKVNEKSIRVSGANKLTAEVKQANGEIHKMTVNLDSNGFARYVDNGIKQFGRLREAVGSIFSGIGGYLKYYLSPYMLVSYTRQVISQITEVDTALTELIKVSDASDNAIAEYFDGAVESAKELGSSVTDMISATADWARLGYNLPDAKQLGEIAVLYKNVGDGIDIESANESLVSTLQGFQLEADDALSIIDAFNEVSNNYAITSGGIGEALQRSAAAFNAANTDLNSAIALVTVGNEVVQSPEKVGTMWQTVSARIRGTKSELEEAGLETDGMVESTSKLRDLVKGYTGVDIMQDENTYKDMLSIIIEIGDAWKELNDIDRAALLEALAGKKQSNTLAATLNNVDRLKEIYQTAENSAGSAQKEQEKYTQSIQYSLDQLTAHGEEFWTTFINKDDVKEFINLLNGIISAGTKIVDTFGSIPSLAGVLGGVAAFKNIGRDKMYSLMF